MRGNCDCCCSRAPQSMRRSEGLVREGAGGVGRGRGRDQDSTAVSTTARKPGRRL